MPPGYSVVIQVGPIAGVHELIYDNLALHTSMAQTAGVAAPKRIRATSLR